MNIITIPFPSNNVIAFSFEIHRSLLTVTTIMLVVCTECIINWIRFCERTLYFMISDMASFGSAIFFLLQCDAVGR